MICLTCGKEITEGQEYIVYPPIVVPSGANGKDRVVRVYYHVARCIPARIRDAYGVLRGPETPAQVIDAKQLPY